MDPKLMDPLEQIFDVLFFSVLVEVVEVQQRLQLLPIHQDELLHQHPHHLINIHAGLASSKERKEFRVLDKIFLFAFYIN